MHRTMNFSLPAEQAETLRVFCREQHVALSSLVRVGALALVLRAGKDPEYAKALSLLLNGLGHLVKPGVLEEEVVRAAKG